MKNVMVYVRESNHAGAEEAAGKQAQLVREFCEKNGYSVCDKKQIVGSRQTAMPEFLELLETAKQRGIDTIVMTTTNRIMGTVKDMDVIQKAIQESGVAIETLDGSHDVRYSSDMVRYFLAMAAAEEDQETQMFGYDINDGEATVNKGEAEVVRYMFRKMQEYSKNPPVELVQSVVDDYRSRGVEISIQEATEKVPMYQIVKLIEAEVKQQWPEHYESLILKQAHNEAIKGASIAPKETGKAHTSVAAPVIDREAWGQVQQKLAENSGFDMAEPKL